MRVIELTEAEVDALKAVIEAVTSNAAVPLALTEFDSHMLDRVWVKLEPKPTPFELSEAG